MYYVCLSQAIVNEDARSDVPNTFFVNHRSVQTKPAPNTIIAVSSHNHRSVSELNVRICLLQKLNVRLSSSGWSGSWHLLHCAPNVDAASETLSFLSMGLLAETSLLADKAFVTASCKLKEHQPSLS